MTPRDETSGLASEPHPAELLSTRVEGNIEVWTMNNPPANALSPEFAQAWEQRLSGTVANDEISVVVITSALRVFSAGADAKWVGRVVREEGALKLLEAFEATLERFRALWLEMRRSDVLFVAALNGHTIAGGLELAAACDLRFAADDERIQIGASEVKLFGVLPSGGGGVQYITRLMGPSSALNFLLEAETCSPRKAHTLGLVERLYAPDDLEHQTMAFAQRAATTCGRVGLNAAKRLTLDASGLPFEPAIEFDREVHWDAMRRGGFLRGIEAFVERYG